MSQNAIILLVAVAAGFLLLRGGGSKPAEGTGDFAVSVRLPGKLFTD